MTPIAPHITKYLRERLPVERQASVHTYDTYAYSFQLLFEFASKQLETTPSDLHLEQIDTPLVLAFLEHLEEERGNSPQARNVRLTAIRSFMRFVEYRVPAALDQIRRILAIPTKKTDSRLVAYLTRNEMQAVLDAPDPTTRDGIRDRAMLLLAFNAGLRVSELIDLRLDGLTLQPQPSIRIRGKGRRERALPLWKETALVLRAWLAVRGHAPTPELFLSSRGEPMGRSGFSYILKKHVTTARTHCPSLRDKHVSPHTLRHSCAMTTLQATGDIRRVALWLGHASVQTTEMYTRADPTEKLETIESLVPPTLQRGRFRPPDALIASLRARSRPSRICARQRPKRARKQTANRRALHITLHCTFPGKPIQRRWHPQRFRVPPRLLCGSRPRLQPSRDRVLRVAPPPAGLGPAPPFRLALRTGAGSLPSTNSRICTKPPAADATRTFLVRLHRASLPDAWCTTPRSHPRLQSRSGAPDRDSVVHSYAAFNSQSSRAPSWHTLT